jgi:DNA polymerase I
MESIALLRTRGLVALVPCRVDGRDVVVLAATDSDAGDAPTITLDEGGRAALRPLLRRTDRVIVADDAHAVQRWLLARDLDVARPLCVRTVEAIVRGEPMWGEPEHGAVLTSIVAARARAVELVRGVDRLLERLEGSGQKKVARLECLVTRAFAALEHRGLPIDVGRWRALIDDEKARLAAAREQVFATAGDAVPRDLFGVPDINLDAEADVKALVKRVTGAALESTAKELLAAVGHPLTEALIAYREPWKLVSTYGDAFLAFATDVVEDAEKRRIGRIRSTFVPLGASTGRVACREPNLQNLPKDARFHEALRAPAGRRLVTADYATCELRIVAELAEDPVFLAAFARGEDLHSTVASSMFGVKVSKSEHPELRQRAKAINFGLVYGMGPGALAASLGVDRGTGEQLLAKYFQTFPRIRDYLDGAVDVALRRGFSETILGRRLTYPPEAVRADNARGELSRIMKNMPIQGTSADMTKLAMVRIHERLVDHAGDPGLVNTIHDELVVECDADHADAVATIVCDEMEDAHRTLLKKVPPLVEVHVGPTWHH